MNTPKELYLRLQDALPKLEALHEEVHSHWGIEDLLYRQYDGLFKVYAAQRLTSRIATALQEIMPEQELDTMFRKIVTAGTEKPYTSTTNSNWESETRPIIEALFHATYFLDMTVKYAKEEHYVSPIPSGWAAVLTLYRLR